MVDATARPTPKGLLGRVAGAMTERVVDVVDPDIVLDHVDLNTLLEKVDVQRVLERIDLNPVLADVDLDALLARVDLDALLKGVDLNALLIGVDLDAVLGELDLESLLVKVDLNKVLSGVDLNALLGRVDLNALLSEVDLDAMMAKVDLNALLADVELEALVRRSGIPEIVADSTSQLAGSTLDVARRQVAALDFWVNRVVNTLMRRPADSLPTAPIALREVSTPGEVGGRREVTGHYAGPVGRTLAYALDGVVITLVYAGAGATFDWLASTFLDEARFGDLNPWISAAIFTTWAFVYFFGSLAVAGHTFGQALVGMRVVSRDGSTLPVLSALVRTVATPFSFLFFGLGLVGVVIGREHRALHDVAGRSAVVLDFGDRPAELPGPLSKFLDRQATLTAP
jgi:uncharacterized RDD family membrane protein YckC